MSVALLHHPHAPLTGDPSPRRSIGSAVGSSTPAWLDARCRPMLVAVSASRVELASRLWSVASRVEEDLADRAWVRSHARASLVARVAMHQAAFAPATDCDALMALGERFFWWGYAAEGVVFWRAIERPLAAHLGPRSEAARRARAHVGALRILAGEASGAEVARAVAEAAQTFGHDHPVTRAALERPAARSTETAAPLPARWCAPRASSWDLRTRRAQWVTLASLRAALGAHGRARRSLVRDSDLDMLRGAMLEELSAELVSSPPDVRHDLVAEAWDRAVAARVDGVAALEDAAAWLGVRPIYD